MTTPAPTSAPPLPLLAQPAPELRPYLTGYTSFAATVPPGQEICARVIPPGAPMITVLLGGLRAGLLTISTTSIGAKPWLHPGPGASRPAKRSARHGQCLRRGPRPPLFPL
jgi:hypothetical protein